MYVCSTYLCLCARTYVHVQPHTTDLLPLIQLILHTQDGVTALIEAATANNLGVVRLLLDAGANLSLADDVCPCLSDFLHLLLSLSISLPIFLISVLSLSITISFSTSFSTSTSRSSSFFLHLFHQSSLTIIHHDRVPSVSYHNRSHISSLQLAHQSFHQCHTHTTLPSQPTLTSPPSLLTLSPSPSHPYPRTLISTLSTPPSTPPSRPHPVRPLPQDYCTPLMKAAERNNLEVIEVLLEHGADINAASRKVTQMHYWHDAMCSTVQCCDVM